MKRKLPSIYHNTFSVKKSNNRDVFYSNSESVSNNYGKKVMPIEENEQQPNYNHILSILNSLYTSSHHVFMIPVEIKTKNNTYDTKIIYRDNNKISTIDGDTIYINDIVDIKIKKSL